MRSTRRPCTNSARGPKVGLMTNIKNLVFTSALLPCFLIASSGVAQEEHPTSLGRPVPCPHPSKLVLHGHDPVTVMPADLKPVTAAGVVGSAFNQTQIDKGFGYTFTFPVCPKECCLWTTGYLTVTFKALEGGPKDSSTSANDLVSVWVNGAAVVPSQRIWPGAVATNAVKTSMFAISGSALTHGHITLVVGDDTAVVSAMLTLEGCCLCTK